MLSALRPQAARPGLPRPLRGRLAVGVRAAVPRSGDGAGQQRPALRRPKPRPLPPAADQVQPAGPPTHKRSRQPAAKQPVSGGTAGSGHLTAQLKAASAPERVMQLVRQAGAVCTAADLTTAVNRLGRLHQRDRHLSDRCRAAFQQLAPIALGQQLDPWAVAQFVWAAGTLWEGVEPKQPFGAQQAAWQQLLAAALATRECKPQSVSNGVLGASKLGWPLEGSLAAAAQASVEWQAARMTPQAASNTLWAFANAGWLLDSRAAAALLQRLEQVLQDAEPQAVSNSLLAATKLGLQLSSSLKAALLQRLEQVLPQAKPQEVANGLWAMSKLGLQLSGSLAAGSVAATQRTAGQMGSQNVANTLWAHANAGWALDSKAAAVLLQRLEQVLPQANAQDVANSLWAAAKLCLQLSSSLQAAFEQALQRIIPAANSQNLGNSLLACGKLRWSPDGRVLAAAVAGTQRQLTSGVIEAQHVCNFLWGLAELQERLAIRLPDKLPALLAAAAGWADSRWARLSALDATDLCYNLARLGHRPGSEWTSQAINRCLECIEADALEGARFANFIWACSSWGHQLQRGELEQLVPAAVDSMAVDWEGGGRGGGLLLGEALTRQEAFQAGPGCPAAIAALVGRLLPLVCADIDLIAAGRLHPETGELPYLAGWAACLTAIGLRLPEQQLEGVCSYVRQHPQQLRPIDASKLEGAFAAWSYQPGLALLGQLAGA